jgi:uncharacterized membrane protein YraQ (UPF0718 family)
MNFILDVTNQAVEEVLLSLIHNWPYQLISILIASALKKHVDLEKVSAFLKRSNKAGVIAATAAAVATPLCSCGTTAVSLGMMAGMMPWAPIIAFMVASPLTSPEELFYSAGIFGWPFALTFFTASIVLGLAGGVAGALLDRGGWLKGQTRMVAVSPAFIQLPVKGSSACDCESREVRLPISALSVCACDTGEIQLSMIVSAACECESIAPAKTKVSLDDFLRETITTGKQLMKMYLGFAFIGFFLNGLIPKEWVSVLFGGNAYSIPLAATLGLPFYISTEASLPLIRALIDGGMSQGAAMAFMISGAGTSVGAIAGALTIARWRVIAVVVVTLWVGAIVFGYLFNTALSLGWT